MSVCFSVNYSYIFHDIDLFYSIGSLKNILKLKFTDLILSELVAWIKIVFVFKHFIILLAGLTARIQTFSNLNLIDLVANIQARAQ